MKKVVFNVHSRKYETVIENGLLNQAAEYVISRFDIKKVLIISDVKVFSLFGNILKDSFLSHNISVKCITFNQGEKEKNIDNLIRLYNEAVDFSMNRNDAVVALGGGVIGDIAGFFASTFLRGIYYINIPTTLLSQTDSSIGGKTAVNMPQGKNLVGSFYQPHLVLTDPSLLNTLDKREILCGVSEVLKYGLIADKKLYEKVSAFTDVNEIIDSAEDIIYTCISIKKRFIEKDENDTGCRMLLNFGHTVAHIIEKQNNYETYTHGEAVGFGMYIAAAAGEELGITKKGTADSIKKVLLKFGLPSEIEVKEELLSTLLLDKKNRGDKVNYVVLKKIGNAFLYKVENKKMCNLIKKTAFRY